MAKFGWFRFGDGTRFGTPPPTTVKLKKRPTTGYQAFISQYVKKKIEGTLPWRLPGGSYHWKT